MVTATVRHSFLKMTLFNTTADSSKAIADNTIEFPADNLRIPELKEIQILTRKMKESRLEWDQKQKQSRK